MKKFFTLIAAAMMVAGANAQTVQVNLNEKCETSIVAGTVLSDNDCFTATTVFNATGSGFKEDGVTTDGEYTYEHDGVTFPAWVQIRVNKEPSADALNGTEQSGSTSVIIVAKKNATLNAYVRTGNNKEVKLFDQATLTALSSTNKFTADKNGKDNLWTWTWTIEAGKTYVLTEKGGTGRLSGFTYELTGGTNGINDINVAPAANENAPVYNLAGQRVSKEAKGILIQNGKKFINSNK